MGTSYSYAHAACCAAQLPEGARVWRGTSAEWGASDYLLAAMEHTLRVIAWQSTKDAQNDRNYPKPVETPADQAKLERMVSDSHANRAFVDRVLGNSESRGGE